MKSRIGIRITVHRPAKLNRAKRPMKHCAFVGLARGGERFYAQNNDISCPLARYNPGLGEPDDIFMHELARTLVDWDDALKIGNFTSLTGESIEGPISGVGAMCGECTAYPIHTGKPNVSLGCTGSRPAVKLKHDELFFALPNRYILSVDLK